MDLTKQIQNIPDEKKYIGLQKALIQFLDRYLAISPEKLDKERRNKIAKLRSYVDIHFKDF